ncbi:hypothetical protein M8C21_021872 [Ambrosia artemisiifolia]|uniref:Uncharacterized protein n=1 Tax=Ambrosia artemisiifolia TaxID=4212 RepID=A0AAD5G8K8_AMBAR|nr:hypothetical protein M8C21_021872 [Ambrosia artemisiifolia]
MPLQEKHICQTCVAPICYAHQAATLMSLCGKFDDMSDTSSSLSCGGSGSSGGGGSTQIQRLHENVRM